MKKYHNRLILTTFCLVVKDILVATAVAKKNHSCYAYHIIWFNHKKGKYEQHTSIKSIYEAFTINMIPTVLFDPRTYHKIAGIKQYYLQKRQQCNRKCEKYCSNVWNRVYWLLWQNLLDKLYLILVLLRIH